MKKLQFFKAVAYTGKVVTGIPPEAPGEVPQTVAEFTDLSFIKLWCWYHGHQCWHVRGVDGVPRCLECCLLDNPVFLPAPGYRTFPPA